MEKLKDEQISLDSNVENKEENCNEIDGEISLGKFKDVNALLNAYNSLQAEFTKRCQKIKELEGQVDKTDNLVAVPTAVVGEIEENKTMLTDEEKEDIVKEYLKQLVSGNKNLVFLENDGVISKTLVKNQRALMRLVALQKQYLINNYLGEKF